MFPCGLGITFLCNSIHTLQTGRAGSECLRVSPSTTEHTFSCPHTPMCASTVMPTKSHWSSCIFCLFVVLRAILCTPILPCHLELVAHCYALSSHDSGVCALSPLLAGGAMLDEYLWLQVFVRTRVLIQQALLEASDIELWGHFSQDGYMRSCPVWDEVELQINWLLCCLRAIRCRSKEIKRTHTQRK